MITTRVNKGYAEYLILGQWMNCCEIARIAGVSHTAIHNRVKREGITVGRLLAPAGSIKPNMDGLKKALQLRCAMDSGTETWRQARALETSRQWLSLPLTGAQV